MAKLKEGSTVEGVPIASQNDLNLIETRIIEGKTVIANAITDKGVNASDSDTFQQLANKIMDISVGEDIKFATGEAGADSVGLMQITGINFSPTTIFYYDDFEGVFAFYSEAMGSNIRGEHIYSQRVFDGEVDITSTGFTMRTMGLSRGTWIALR